MVDAFDDLVQVLPVGKVGKAAAQKLRDSSVVRSAVLVRAYIALLCQIREIGGSPAEYFGKLPGKVTLEADSDETVLKDGQIVPASARVRRSTSSPTETRSGGRPGSCCPAWTRTPGSPRWACSTPASSAMPSPRHWSKAGSACPTRTEMPTR